MCCSRVLIDVSHEYHKVIARILAKISFFVHPDVVRMMQEYNYINKEYFRDLLHRLVDARIIDEDRVNVLMDVYLFDGSDCVFPFTRRSIGRESSLTKRVFNLDKSIILDDNAFPRNLWTYLVLGVGYSSNSWRNSGASSFELAHIFNHKRTGNTEAMDNFFVAPEEDFHGSEYMFSSASNVVLIPKGMAKPTDGLQLVQKMFFQRAMDLYGNTIFKSRPDYHLSEEERKLYESLQWLEPYRPDDWEIRLDNLNRHRMETIEEILRSPIE